ncbi:MAG: hypothetical protein R3Y26_08435 [Rikenellaceae bacterium]
MRKLTILIASFILSNGAFAQSADELYSMSLQYKNFSTSRVSAMGGAFTSLGADISSIGINPAGIAMYKGNGAFSITPSLNIASTKSNSYSNNNYSSTEKENATKGILANVGLVYNSELRGSGLKSVAVGFSYNTNYSNKAKSVVNGLETSSSILDMFSAQATGYSASTLKDYDVYLSEYGAAGAYDAGLIFKPYSNENSYFPSYENTNGELVGSLIEGDIVTPQLIRVVEEHSSDYNFSLGFNVNDVLYLGTTLGCAEYHSSLYNDYSEYASYSNYGDMDNMLYSQTINKNAIAFNFIFGATLQPMPGLRIGASIQAPKIYSVQEEYQTYVLGEFYENGDIVGYGSLSPLTYSEYKVKTPTRLNTGISYAFGKVALLSVDYERIWYNQIKMKYSGDRSYLPEVTEEIQNTYKPTNNIRAGLELNIPGGLVLRGGYAYYDSALKDSDYGAVTSISGGLGYRVGTCSIDLTYVNMSTKATPFLMYDYYSDYYDQYFSSSSISQSKLTNHNIMLTFSWRL